MGQTSLFYYRFFICLLACLCAACAQQPVRARVPTRWIGSPNFDTRTPNYVVLHHTSNNAAAAALSTLTDPASKVSAHYLIVRDGQIYQLVGEQMRAWHAGASRWASDTDLNSDSIGIELDNNGEEPFPDAQVSSLLRLLADIKVRDKIPVENFIGHSDVAPTRKSDPSRLFPWKTLAAAGYGRWCNLPENELNPVPQGFDPLLALRSIGYDTSNPEAAMRAFKLHFVQDEAEAQFNAHDLEILHCLVRTPENELSEGQNAPR